MTKRYDVVVVGAGNAGLCAALAARGQGGEVLVLERAPQNERGGNSYFTGGTMRLPYYGVDDVRQLVPDITDEEAANIDFGQYTSEDYFVDMARLTDYQADPELTNHLIDQAFPTAVWMREQGVRFGLALGRQAFKVDGKFRFWGGLVVETIGGGVGLVDTLFEVAEKQGVDVWYEARAERLLTHNDAVAGVRVRRNGQWVDVPCSAVILAAGGFEANPEMRARYLGPDWDLAKVRGTRHNMGEGIRMALDIGAQPFGHWSGCHSVAWDLNAPPVGDRKVGDSFQKHSYPLGIMVNNQGKRFVDEGADFRNYTYAKYGKEILLQPDRVAFQIFDSKVLDKLRDEYRIREVTKETADTLEELARKLEINVENFVRTVEEYNRAVQAGKFDPTIKDGKATKGIDPPKSNWALPLDTPPYHGYATTCGITFTFGGLKVNTSSEVLDTEDTPIPGLYAAGELVGGLFYHNYPGGTGLMAGSVFGRTGGSNAAQYALQEEAREVAQ